MNWTQTILIALVAVNLGLGLYLAWLFVKLRQEISDTRTEARPADGEEGTVEELLDRVAGEIEQAGMEMSAHLEAVDRRLLALEERLQSAIGDIDSLKSEVRGRAAGSAEADIPEPDDLDNQEGGTAAESFRERHAEVGRLLADGKSVQEIARLVRMSEGEVELVAGLRERLGVQPDEPQP